MAKHWTTEEINILIKLYPDTITKQISLLLNRSIRSVVVKAYYLNIHKSKAFYTTLHGGRHNLFKKGCISWNKGKKFNAISTNYRPIGSVYVNKQGYTTIKTENSWMQLSHVKWKEYYGEYPQKGMYVTFKDSDKNNFTKENLECMHPSDILKNNTIQRFPLELVKLIRLQAKIAKLIKNKGRCDERENYSKSA